MVAILQELSRSGDFNDQMIADLIKKAKGTISPELYSLFEHEVVQQVKHLRIGFKIIDFFKELEIVSHFFNRKLYMKSVSDEL